MTHRFNIFAPVEGLLTNHKRERNPVIKERNSNIGALHIMQDRISVNPFIGFHGALGPSQFMPAPANSKFVPIHSQFASRQGELARHNDVRSTHRRNIAFGEEKVVKPTIIERYNDRARKHTESISHVPKKQILENVKEFSQSNTALHNNDDVLDNENKDKTINTQQNHESNMNLTETSNMIVQKKSGETAEEILNKNVTVRLTSTTKPLSIKDKKQNNHVPSNYTVKETTISSQTPIDRSDVNYYEEYYTDSVTPTEEYLYDYYQYYDEFKSMMNDGTLNENYDTTTTLEAPTSSNSPLLDTDYDTFMSTSSYSTPSEEEMSKILTADESTTISTLDSEILLPIDSGGMNTNGEVSSQLEEKKISDTYNSENEGILDSENVALNDEIIEEVDLLNGSTAPEMTEREKEIERTAQKYRDRIKNPPKFGRGSFRHRLNLLNQRRQQATITRVRKPTTAPIPTTQGTPPRPMPLDDGRNHLPGYIKETVHFRGLQENKEQKSLPNSVRIRNRITPSPAPLSEYSTTESSIKSDTIVNRYASKAISDAELKVTNDNTDKLTISDKNQIEEIRTTIPFNQTRSLPSFIKTSSSSTLPSHVNTESISTSLKQNSEILSPNISSLDENFNLTNPLAEIGELDPKNNSQASILNFLNNLALFDLDVEMSNKKINTDETPPIDLTPDIESTTLSSMDDLQPIYIAPIKDEVIDDKSIEKAISGAPPNYNSAPMKNSEKEVDTSTSPSKNMFTNTNRTVHKNDYSEINYTSTPFASTLDKENSQISKEISRYESDSITDDSIMTIGSTAPTSITNPTTASTSITNPTTAPTSITNPTTTQSSLSSNNVSETTETNSMKINLSTKNISSSSNALSEIVLPTTTEVFFSTPKIAKTLDFTSTSPPETTISNTFSDEPSIEILGTNSFINGEEDKISRSITEYKNISDDSAAAGIIKEILNDSPIIKLSTDMPDIFTDMMKKMKKDSMRITNGNGTTSFTKIERGNKNKPAVKTTITLFTDSIPSPIISKTKNTFMKIHEAKDEKIRSKDNVKVEQLNIIPPDQNTSVPTVKYQPIKLDRKRLKLVEVEDPDTDLEYSTMNTANLVTDSSYSPSTEKFFTEKPIESSREASLQRLQQLLSQFDSGFRPEFAMTQFLGLGIESTEGTTFKANIKPTKSNTIFQKNNYREFILQPNLESNLFDDQIRSPMEIIEAEDLSSGKISQQALTNTIERKSFLSSNLEDLSLAASEDINSENSIMAITELLKERTTQNPERTSLADLLKLANNRSPTTAIVTETTVDNLRDTGGKDIITTTNFDLISTTDIPEDLTTIMGEINNNLNDSANLTSNVLDALLNTTRNSSNMEKILKEFPEILEKTTGRLTAEVDDSDDVANTTMQLKQFLLNQRVNNGNTTDEKFISSDAVRERLRLLRIFKARKERQTGISNIQKHFSKVKGATKVYQRTDDVNLENIGVRVNTAVKLRDILSRKHDVTDKEETREEEIEQYTTTESSPIFRYKKIKGTIGTNSNNKKQINTNNIIKVNGFRIIRDETESPKEAFEFSQGTQPTVTEMFVPDEISKVSFLPTVPPHDRFKQISHSSQDMGSKTSIFNRDHPTQLSSRKATEEIGRDFRQNTPHSRGNQKKITGFGGLEDFLVRQSPRNEASSLASRLRNNMNKGFLPTVPPTTPSPIEFNDEYDIYMTTERANHGTSDTKSFDSDLTTYDPENAFYYDYYYDTTESSLPSYTDYPETSGRSKILRPDYEDVNSALQFVDQNQYTSPIEHLTEMTQDKFSPTTEEFVIVGDSVKDEIDALLADSQIGFVDHHAETRGESNMDSGNLFIPPDLTTEIADYDYDSTTIQNFRTEHRDLPPAPLTHRIQPPMGQNSPLFHGQQKVHHIVHRPTSGFERNRLAPPSAILRSSLKSPATASPINHASKLKPENINGRFDHKFKGTPDPNFQNNFRNNLKNIIELPSNTKISAPTEPSFINSNHNPTDHRFQHNSHNPVVMQVLVPDTEDQIVNDETLSPFKEFIKNTKRVLSNDRHTNKESNIQVLPKSNRVTHPQASSTENIRLSVTLPTTFRPRSGFNPHFNQPAFQITPNPRRSPSSRKFIPNQPLVNDRNAQIRNPTMFKTEHHNAISTTIFPSVHTQNRKEEEKILPFNPLQTVTHRPHFQFSQPIFHESRFSITNSRSTNNHQIRNLNRFEQSERTPIGQITASPVIFSHGRSKNIEEIPNNLSIKTQHFSTTPRRDNGNFNSDRNDERGRNAQVSFHSEVLERNPIFNITPKPQPVVHSNTNRFINQNNGNEEINSGNESGARFGDKQPHILSQLERTSIVSLDPSAHSDTRGNWFPPQTSLETQHGVHSSSPERNKFQRLSSEPEIKQTAAQFLSRAPFHNSNGQFDISTPRPGILLPLGQNGNVSSKERWS